MSRSPRGRRSVADRVVAAVEGSRSSRYASWPNFRCVAVDPDRGEPCGAPASCAAAPIARSAATWFYCDRHQPAGAVPIPADQPFVVARLDLRVAVALAPGDLDAAADESVRRVIHALEAVGVLPTGIRVVGQKAAPANQAAATLRLQLAGPPVPVERRSSFVGPLDASGAVRWRRRRKAS